MDPGMHAMYEGMGNSLHTSAAAPSRDSPQVWLPTWADME
jgi:hypothetical protein